MASSALTNLQFPAVAADPFAASTENLLVVTFSRSNSPNFPLAISISQGASKFGVSQFGGRPIFLVVFARTQADAGRAKALLSFVSGWKGTLLFARGKIISNGYQFTDILNCYLDACSCNDTKAHCLEIIDDPAVQVQHSFGARITIRLTERPTYKEEIKIDRYAFPCKQLRPYFRFQKDHPASAQDQIQAAAVDKGCDACPLFDPAAYRIVGTKSVFREHDV